MPAHDPYAVAVAIGFRRGRETLAVKPILDEVIDRIADERRIFRLRDCRPSNGLIRPVPLIHSPLRDPPSDGVLLLQRFPAWAACFSFSS